MPDSPYFWAKTTSDGHPGCSVREHGFAAAAVARLLLEHLPKVLNASLPEGLLPLVALHDVGKISPGFQTLCAQWHGPNGDTDDETLRQWRKYDSAHAASSQWILKQYYREQHSDKHLGKRWAECVGAHHGRYAQRTRNTSIWAEYCCDLIADVEAQLGPLPVQPLENQVLQEWIIGLIEVADWIASNEEYFPASGGLETESLSFAARNALYHIGFSRERAVCPGKSWAELFPHAPTPRPVQQHLWELPAHPGTYIVEDSMGGGKTEAALGLAYHLIEAGLADGLYFALPTQTTSNRIFNRVADFLQRAGARVNEHSLRLAHGNSWLLEDDIYQGWKTHGDESHTCARNWFASSRRALLARFGVGTIDQALMSELDVKHSFVRRFALAGKVVILDEVHSYDMYTGSLLDRLVHNLRRLGASVIILSATLTRPRIRTLLELSMQEGDFGTYPLFSTRTGQGTYQENSLPPKQSRVIHVSCESMELDASVQIACARADAGQCVLWIRNTVADAQEAYRRLCAERREGGPELGLLHARFPLWRRQELESEWIDRLGKDGARRPAGCVLVATQVAEQSLDIDADFLITDLSPTDMLLQRAGRLWRHERPLPQRHAHTAEMLILSAQLLPEGATQELLAAMGASGRVFAPYVLMRSYELWRTKTLLKLPSDIRSLMESTYAERPEAPGTAWEDFLNELDEKKKEMAQLALVNSAKGTCTRDDRDDISTRYNTRPQIDLLLLSRKPEVLSATVTKYSPLHGAPFCIDRTRWTFSAARSIQQNIVKVPRNKHTISLLSDTELPVIAGYGFSQILPLYPLDASRPNCYAHGIVWTPELGVCIARPATATETTSLHDTEK